MMHLKTDVVHFVQHGLYANSVAIPNPQIMLISLIVHTTLQAHRAYQSFDKGENLEGVSSLILSFMGAYQCRQMHIEMKPISYIAKENKHVN